jgi:hypothetical protein
LEEPRRLEASLGDNNKDRLQDSWSKLKRGSAQMGTVGVGEEVEMTAIKEVFLV